MEKIWNDYIKRHGMLLVIVLMIGIVASMSAAAMWISGSKSFDKLYDVGEVYEVEWEQKQINGTGWEYDKNKDTVSIQGDIASKSFEIRRKPYVWKYCVVEIENMNQESMNWDIVYYDPNGIAFVEENSELKEGVNQIPLLTKDEISKIEVKVNNSSGLNFRLKSLQFRKTYLNFTVEKFIKTSLFFYLVYFIKKN